MLFGGILSVVAVIVTETDTSFDCIPVSQTVLGHGVVSALAKRVTAENAPYHKEKSEQKSPFAYRVVGVRGAGGTKSATGRTLCRREILAVEFYRYQKQVLHTVFSPF